MEINANTILTAAVSAVFGAGGLGGILTLVGKSREADAAVVRQYYDKISARVDVLDASNAALEARVDTLTRENMELHAERAADRLQMETMRQQHRVEIDAMRQQHRIELDTMQVQLDRLMQHSEASNP